ncbi:hypothetical protein [Halocola ammonii]
MKIARPLSAFSIRFASVAIAFLLIPFFCISQDEEDPETKSDTNKIEEQSPVYFGFSPGMGFFKRTSEGGVPGKTFHRANFNGGLTLLAGDFEEFTFKTGLEINFFRSAYVNDTSYYEEFLTIPFLFQLGSFANEFNDKFFSIHFGLAMSLSAGNGYAGAFDEFYIKEEGQFLDYAKVSGLTEFAFYSKQMDGFNAIGLRLSADLTTGEQLDGLKLQPQRYFMATVFASFLFGE